MLRSRYFDRLGFSDEEANALSNNKPSKESLDKIMEAHLKEINFENLSQHGLPYAPSLDMKYTAKKVLDEQRGGFCFELNGLLAELLLELGYNVKRVPAIVHVADIGFDHMPTHLVLVVSVPGKEDIEEWFVDVGFGEPAIHSLHYELSTVQQTPEGMTTRMVACPKDSDCAILEWKKEGLDDEHWVPRLKWKFQHPGQPLEEFQPALEEVLKETSIFHKKALVVWIDRNQKVSLSGTKWKRTSPRFGPNKQVTVKQFGSFDEVKEVLQKDFGVEAADKLILTRSIEADPEVWDQF